MLDFVIVAFCIFMVIKAMNRLTRKEEAAEGADDQGLPEVLLRHSDSSDPLPALHVGTWRRTNGQENVREACPRKRGDDVPARRKDQGTTDEDSKNASLLLASLLLSCFATLGAASTDDAATLPGQPADIAPSAYQYRADRKPDENPPESWIALMKFAGLPLNKPVDVNAPALKKVLCGLIWEEVRRVRRVALVFGGPAERRPKPEEVVVTCFDAEAKGIPTWWNETTLREAGGPEVSADGREYTFAIPVDTFGLVVSVRGSKDASAYDVPEVRAFAPDRWKQMDLEIEWGFDESTAGLDYSGRIEAYDGRDRPSGAAGRRRRHERQEWRQLGVGVESRRPARRAAEPAATSARRNGGRSGRTTPTRTTSPARSSPCGPGPGNFSFLASDLEHGPILAPEYGFFVRATRLSPAETSEADPEEAVPRRCSTTSSTPCSAIRRFAAGTPAATRRGSPATPTDQPVTVEGITFPARCVAMHPGEDRDVAVGWRSPIDGRVGLTASDRRRASQRRRRRRVVPRVHRRRRTESARPRSHRPRRRTVILASTAKSNSPTSPSARATCSRWSSAAAATTSATAPRSTLVVIESGGEKRTWDLAKDVLADIRSGNPHADSLGNAGVWSFFQPTPPSLHQPPFELSSRATSAREFVRELAARNLTTIRQRTRQHAEQTWDGAVAAMYPGKTLPPIPKPASEPPMKVEVPCERLTAQWNLGAWHLARHAVKDDRGRLRFNDHPYGILAAETYLVLYALDLTGVHDAAADGLDQWLALPLANEKPVGLFSDGDGCLAHAVGPPGVGGNMDGVDFLCRI